MLRKMSKFIRSAMGKKSITSQDRMNAYVQGMLDFSLGNTHNVYPDGSVMSNAWKSGYHDAQKNSIRKTYKMQFDMESG